jgi:hypothetical protein
MGKSSAAAVKTRPAILEFENGPKPVNAMGLESD